MRSIPLFCSIECFEIAFLFSLLPYNTIKLILVKKCGLKKANSHFWGEKDAIKCSHARQFGTKVL